MERQSRGNREVIGRSYLAIAWSSAWPLTCSVWCSHSAEWSPSEGSVSPRVEVATDARKRSVAPCMHKTVTVRSAVEARKGSVA